MNRGRKLTEERDAQLRTASSVLRFSARTGPSRLALVANLARRSAGVALMMIPPRPRAALVAMSAQHPAADLRAEQTARESDEVAADRDLPGQLETGRREHLWPQIGGRGSDRSPHRQSVALSVVLRLIAAGPLFVLACIWIVFTCLTPFFLTRSNLVNILVQSSSVALLALGALVVVIVGSLDLSLGSTVGLCTIVGAVLFRDHPSLAWLIVPAMIATGLAIGMLNSLVIVTLRFGNAFIVTLGMLYVVQSLSDVESGGVQVAGLPHYVLVLANGHIAGIPGPVILVLAAGGVLAFLLNRVAWGRWIVAIGGSADSARKVGIPVRKVLFSVYIIAGLFAGLTGILVAGLNDAGATDNGLSILYAIAAVVIGGASLTGGRGSVWNTIVGAVILGSIANGLTLLSISSNWEPFAVGAVLIAAVGLETLRRNFEERLRVRQAHIQSEA